MEPARCICFVKIYCLWIIETWVFELHDQGIAIYSGYREKHHWVNLQKFSIATVYLGIPYYFLKAIVEHP